MDKLLKFLSGKKAIIAGIITTTAALLVQLKIILPEIGTYIGAITTLIFGTASLATARAYKAGRIK